MGTMEQLAGMRTRLQALQGRGYQDPLGFVNVPFDTDYQAKIMAAAREKKNLKPKLILLIGIGGSNLGTLAVHEALNGLYYNDLTQGPLFYCADAVDVDSLYALHMIVEKVLQRDEQVLLIVVSKSGTTTETAANAQLFCDLLKRYRPDDYHKYMVAITDKDSFLWRQATTIGCQILEVPQQVGGRFSVFTAVALFPLALLGIDIEQLCAGARLACEDDEAAAQRAIWLFDGMQKNLIHDLFIFDASWAAVGAWYRQLIAESLGKNAQDVIIPTISTAVDLHSQIQLYFGGPAIRQTIFLIAEPQYDLKLQGSTFFDKKRSLTEVQKVIEKGVQQAYQQAGLRYTTMTVQKNAAAVGHWLQSAMLTTVYLGHLMKVNVFDQPQVELYKKEIRALL